MKILLRIVLIVAMLTLAWEALLLYAFRFNQGYPFWPLAALASTYWVFTRVRCSSAPKERPLSYDHQSIDRLLVVILAIIGAATILNLRNEPPFQLTWYPRLATLSLFLLIVPQIIAAPFLRSHLVITAVSCLILIGVLWQGTLRSATRDDRDPLPHPAPQRSAIESITSLIRSSASFSSSLNAS